MQVGKLQIVSLVKQMQSFTTNILQSAIRVNREVVHNQRRWVRMLLNWADWTLLRKLVFAALVPNTRSPVMKIRAQVVQVMNIYFGY